MKLIKARFENFRSLRDLEIDFSTNPEKRLTVIRAENESGKTTILTALQWALYGNDALPKKGKEFRISPIDWDIARGNKISISVEVDFETFGGEKSERKQYRIIRNADEVLNDNKYELRNLNVKLYEITEKGFNSIDYPEALIKDELPTELREVFFTDGDRTLDFIETRESRQDIKNRRERVSKAVHSLLELEVIESALKHVKISATEANRNTRGIGQDADLDETIEKLEKTKIEIESLEKDKKDSKKAYEDFTSKLEEFEQQIEMALSKGDKAAFEKEIKDTKSEMQRRSKEKSDVVKEHSSLFRKTSLARDLLVNILESSLSKLDELRDQGKFPNTAIPILEERLKAGICICGETLDDNDTNAKDRKQHIEKNIEESLQTDQLQTAMTELYFGAQHLQPSTVEEEEKWISLCSKVASRREDIKNALQELELKQKEIEIKLDKIPDTKISDLRQEKKKYAELRDEHMAKFQRSETKLEALKKENDDLESKRNKFLREKEKGELILANLTAIKDIEYVLQKACNRIKNEELKKVSNYMNETFLEMIGAAPKQGGTIQRTEIDQEFDIIAYGTNNRTINPDDLNGASRRALTLAFILALTKISGVEAPNVIDTPLGMLSGFVKISVLKTAIRESSQLILFLTPSEISDCEEIINEHADSIITLTNSTHYPKMLKNDPKTEDGRIIRCRCKDLGECKICARYKQKEIS